MKKTTKKAKKASKTPKVTRENPRNEERRLESRSYAANRRLDELERRVTALEMGELHEDEDGPTLIAPR
jgi:hypothetical protein